MPITKITPRRKSGHSPGLRELPTICVMDVASDFKFGKELWFANSNYKITPKDKNRRGPLLGSSQKYGVPPEYCCNG